MNRDLTSYWAIAGGQRKSIEHLEKHYTETGICESLQVLVDGSLIFQTNCSGHN